ncbi:MAG: sarcosine oxidase subunit gamma [Roseovarius sp.]|nr:sarcosine oxidase subunit gamma [Roseovarius sp.]
MAELSLFSTPPLDGYDKSTGDIRLYSPEALAVVSIALPLGSEDSALAIIASAYGVDLPSPGKSVIAPDGARLVRLGLDQAFIIFPHSAPDAEDVVQGKLEDAVYVTDQTDAWTALAIEGSSTRDALERICPIDLHPKSFAVDDAARTVMEHLGVLIIRAGDNDFLLLSASSSANSFLHALETSIANAG